MLQEKKRQARKFFWLALVLSFVAEYYSASQQPSTGVTGDFGGALATAFVRFPFGFLAPASKLSEITLASADPLTIILSCSISLLSVAALLYGARLYARAKGYHSGFGYLGLIGFAGIGILLILPDRAKGLYQ